MCEKSGRFQIPQCYFGRYVSIIKFKLCNLE